MAVPSSRVDLTPEWLRARLAAPWSASSLAPLLDAQSLDRLRAAWPTIPGGHAATKQRVLLALLCMQPPLTTDVTSSMRALLQTAAADGALDAEWGRVAAGLVLHLMPAIAVESESGSTEMQLDTNDGIVSAPLQKAVHATLAAAEARSRPTAFSWQTRAIGLSLDDVPFEARLLAPSHTLASTICGDVGVGSEHFRVADGAAAAIRVRAVADAMEAAATAQRQHIESFNDEHTDAAVAHATHAASESALRVVLNTDSGGAGVGAVARTTGVAIAVVSEITRPSSLPSLKRPRPNDDVDETCDGGIAAPITAPLADAEKLLRRIEADAAPLLSEADRALVHAFVASPGVHPDPSRGEDTRATLVRECAVAASAG